MVPDEVTVQGDSFKAGKMDDALGIPYKINTNAVAFFD